MTFSCNKKEIKNADLPGASPRAVAASPVGDVVGKITVGYQGWFAAPGDGSPINVWWHWSQDWSQPPSPTNQVIKCWPDMREYTATFQTAFANLGNGQPATLFSSYTQQTINTHFLWMRHKPMVVNSILCMMSADGRICSPRSRRTGPTRCRPWCLHPPMPGRMANPWSVSGVLVLMTTIIHGAQLSARMW